MKGITKMLGLFIKIMEIGFIMFAILGIFLTISRFNLNMQLSKGDRNLTLLGEAALSASCLTEIAADGYPIKTLFSEEKILEEMDNENDPNFRYFPSNRDEWTEGAGEWHGNPKSIGRSTGIADFGSYSIKFETEDRDPKYGAAWQGVHRSVPGFDLTKYRTLTFWHKETTSNCRIYILFKDADYSGAQWWNNRMYKSFLVSSDQKKEVVNLWEIRKGWDVVTDDFDPTRVTMIEITQGCRHPGTFTFDGIHFEIPSVSCINYPRNFLLEITANGRMHEVGSNAAKSSSKLKVFPAALNTSSGDIEPTKLTVYVEE